MGAKDSKLAFLTYEEACKRVTDAELKRLKDSFKRYAGANNYMNRNTFIKEVLGDGVPPKLAELLFMACSGNQKGIGFKELVCGLVLLTRGRQDEKLKFLFSLYCNPGSNLIQKTDMDARILDTEGHLPQSLSLLFKDSDQITYECFQKWVLQNQEVTSLTKWLLKEPSVVSLSNNLETPTFYQTLAGVTHLEEPDIIELETRYWQLKSQSKTGRFDMETFQTAVCPPVPHTLSQGLFAAFDENFDGHIDFKEMACGISACCRGPFTERLKFCFKVFDKDHDGLLSRAELVDMVAALLVIHHDNKCALGEVIDASENITPESMAETIISKHDSDGDDCITQEEFLVWAISHPLPTVFTTVLFQVCHIVLGLKPQNKKDEGLIVKGWLKREEQHGLAVGQTWYLVAMQWWQQWQAYVHCQSTPQTVFDETGNSMVLNTSPSPDPGGGCGHISNGKKSHNRTGSLNLCPGLSWRSSITFDESVPLATYQISELTINSDHSQEASPLKSATLPRSSPRPVANNSNNSSVNNSPRVTRKLDGVIPVEIAKPGPIENSPLTTTTLYKVPTLTNEGAHLRRDKTLVRGRDFELVSEPVWKALSVWYGGSPALPRNVIQLKTGAPPELELYPLCVQLLKHQVINHRPTQVPSFSGMMGGIGGMVVNSTGLANISTNIVPRRYLAYTAVFSRKHTLRQVYEFLTSRLKINREELRLWKYKDDQNMALLEDEQKTMIQLGIEDNSQILIEVRNKDLTWPEEMSQIAKNKSAFDKSQQGPTERGATGLSNLGNTCFMNAALQCVSNTQILTQYFRGGMHLYELNRTNPLGMKGHLAQRYGELIKDLWSGNSKCIAPLKFRWTIGRYAPRFNGFQQHDSQELLAFLLDGLHEDLNRVHEKPYVELKDSDGRPDSVVAKEAWDNHLLRNKSIVVDLFHGQLKSTVRCCYCGNTSVRFDPFTFLSLPLPMDSSIHIELQVMWLDGSLPTKYGLRLNVDEKYCQLKKQLSELCGVPAEELLLVELLGASVRSIPDDKQKVKSVVTGGLYAYQLKPPSQCLPSEPIQSGSTLESLAQIQREYTGSSPVRRLKLTQESSTNPPNGHHKSSSNDNQPHSQPNDDEQESSKASNCDIKSAHSPHLVNGNCISNQSQQETGQRNGTASNAEVKGQPLGPARSLPAPEAPLSHFIIAVHRKMIRQDLYFLSSQKTCPSLFGIPLILPCDEQTTRLDLYHLVWTQVARLVSPLPPSETANPNHAHDCDDSLGYEYPFTLKAVSKDGMTCAWCPWYRFCRGCKLECDQELFAFGTDHIAIDWEPTALHLRYQSSQEQVFEEHSSVIESRKKQTEPISLDSCLQAFTKEEELGDQELYYCSKCKEHRQAIKKLEIWKLPPILIIHLKRFQFHNGRWIKSHKIVNIPKKNFDPSSYVVPRLKTTDDYTDGLVDEEEEEPENTDEIETSGRQSKRHLSTSSETDYTTVKYDLFAMSCHIGILGGGHYVAYARNPNKKWYCYNDSSCKEVSEDQIDTNSAYILFYERQTLNQGRFMPDIRGKEPDVAEIDDVADSDLRKMCVIQ